VWNVLRLGMNLSIVQNVWKILRFQMISIHVCLRTAIIMMFGIEKHMINSILQSVWIVQTDMVNGK